jgi:MFS transporter, FSR family, fosmidomycin resistance protein
MQPGDVTLPPTAAPTPATGAAPVPPPGALPATAEAPPAAAHLDGAAAPGADAVSTATVESAPGSVPAPPRDAPPADVASAPADGVVSLATWRGRSLLGAFLGAHLSHHVANSLLNPLLPYIRDAFGLSYTQSGFLVSAMSLSWGLSNAPLGALADKIGSRPLIAAGLVLMGAVSVALGLAQAYWQLLVLLVLMGIVSGTYHAPSASLIARLFPTRVRGMVMGLHITGGHLSFFATPLLAAVLVSATGTWRTPYLWFAIAPIAAGILMWFMVPPGREPSGGATDRWAVFREAREVIRLVGPLVSFSIVFQIVYAALFAFLTLYLVDARGFPPAFAAVLFAFPQLVGMLGAPLGGYLSDTLGRRTVILLGIGGLGPAVWSLTWVPDFLILVSLGAIGLMAAIRTTVTEVLVMDSAPPHRRATLLGGYYMLSQELGGLAAPALGFAAGAWGIGVAYGGATLGLAILSGAVLLLQRRL